jgi:catechol 2,3-dioxygenase-like lactoylglutathione lyase family enzyme
MPGALHGKARRRGAGIRQQLPTRSRSAAMNVANAPTPSIHGVAQIALSVRDIAAATAFYRDTLGLPLLFEVPNLSFFDVGGVRLMLSTGGEPGGRGTLIYLKVGDIAATHAALAAAGVTFEQKPHVVGKTPTAEVWLAILNDPDANPIGLMSETPLTT